MLPVLRPRGTGVIVPGFIPAQWRARLDTRNERSKWFVTGSEVRLQVRPTLLSLGGDARHSGPAGSHAGLAAPGGHSMRCRPVRKTPLGQSALRGSPPTVRLGIDVHPAWPARRGSGGEPPRPLRCQLVALGTKGAPRTVRGGSKEGPRLMAAKRGFGPPRGLPTPRGFVARQGGLIRLEERPESRGGRAVEAGPRGGRAVEP